MSLTAKDVAEITRLLEESAFDELDLEIDGLKLHLRRASAGDARPATTDAGVQPAMPAMVAAAPVPEAVDDPELHCVAAPLLGVFYRAPKPGASPFVEPGSPVEEVSIVGIIEVMKLMNTVRAGVRGTVVDIAASDGGLVEYGATLLRVRRSA